MVGNSTVEVHLLTLFSFLKLIMDDKMMVICV